jgi:hypothetical protein
LGNGGEKVEFSQGVARVMDSIVGFFMLGLGLYGAYTALQFQDDNVRASELLGSRGSRGSQSQNEVYNFEDVNEIELSELNNNNSDR